MTFSREAVDRIIAMDGCELDRAVAKAVRRIDPNFSSAVTQQHMLSNDLGMTFKALHRLREARLFASIKDCSDGDCIEVRIESGSPRFASVSMNIARTILYQERSIALHLCRCILISLLGRAENIEVITE